MKWIYDNYFIMNNEIIFFAFVISIILMIFLAFYFVKKELNKHDVT